MDKYISRDKVIELITEDKVRMDDNTLRVAAAIGGSYSAIDCFNAINDTCYRHIKSVKEIPEADVVPVKHGRWISIGHKLSRICSVCNCDEPYKFADDDANVYDYCPNCGAKMDGGA